jgi:hypothetical protein
MGHAPLMNRQLFPRTLGLILPIIQYYASEHMCVLFATFWLALWRGEDAYFGKLEGAEWKFVGRFR